MSHFRHLIIRLDFRSVKIFIGSSKKEQKTAVLVTHDLSEAISMADRNFCAEQTPGRDQKEIKLDFNMKERTPMQVRNAPEFKSYFNLIWKELNEHD